MSAPLWGHNLVRLVYLDEAGTDRVDAPFLSVGGVLSPPFETLVVGFLVQAWLATSPPYIETM
jgi:hypothetical protein